MKKLYKLANGVMHYHEAWEVDGDVLEHWGVVGERGETKEHRLADDTDSDEAILRILQPALENGFSPIEPDQHAILLIEYLIDGFGTKQDLDKRYALQARMDETLGWTGLGNCDGGSIGSGTMEACCFVVDLATAKRVIVKDLKGTEFGDYSRIYQENED